MKVEPYKIGFLGFGNMGQAIAEGWLSTQKVNAKQLYASARNQERLTQNTARLDIRAVESNKELIQNVDIVILAVKPHQIKDIVVPLKEELADKIVVSLAVNVLFDELATYLLPETQHLSTLPNTPVSIGEGIVIFEEKHSLTQESFNRVKDLFHLISHVEIIASDQMGIAGLISGSAPAFVDLFIEALGDAAVKHGLNRQTAYRLISQMVSGTGALQLHSARHPGELKDDITSPGGTTIQGIAALEKSGFRGSIIQAVDDILN